MSSFLFISTNNLSSISTNKVENSYPHPCPRWIEEQIFGFFLIVPGGCGNLLFVTDDHFLHVRAGHGRGVDFVALEEGTTSGSGSS